jgi:hypothetical protein
MSNLGKYLIAAGSVTSGPANKKQDKFLFLLLKRLFRRKK